MNAQPPAGSLENTSVAPARVVPRPVVLVTGGSSGIGKALAMEFASNRHDIFLTARNEQRLLAARSEVAEKTGAQVFVHAGDLAADDGCERLNHALVAQGCGVEILVNNAGVGAMGAFASSDPEELERLLKLNIFVPTILTRMFLPDMIARARGGILSVASVSGHGPVPYIAAYGSSKGFLISLSQSIAPEVIGTGVRVSVLSPGPVHTDLLQNMFSGGGRLSWLYPKLPPDVAARIGYDGFATGKRVIVPGLMNWFVVFGTKIFPKRFLARFFAFAVRANATAKL